MDEWEKNAEWKNEENNSEEKQDKTRDTLEEEQDTLEKKTDETQEITGETEKNAQDTLASTTEEAAEVTASEAAEELTEEPTEAPTEEAAEEPTEEPTEEPAEDTAVPTETKAERGSVAGLVLALAALLAILAYAWMNPIGKVVDTGILYAKDDNLYYYDLKNEPYLLQEGLNAGGVYHYFYTAWGASVTEDGSWVYFSDDIDENGGFVLYRREAKKAAAKAVQIDTDVYDYMASKDGEVVAYLKKSGETYALCVYDGKEVQTVQNGINLENGVYALSGNGKYLVFTDTTGLLHAAEVGKNTESVPLTDSAETYAVAEESGMLYYAAAGEEGYSIFGYDFQGEPAVVAENVSSMEMLPNGRDLLYCKKSDKQVLYRDIIIDDMAETDAEMQEDDENYEKKQERDAIREAMEKGEGFEPLLLECYLLTGGKSVLVTENAVAAVQVNEDRPYAVGYRAKEFTPMRLSVMDGGLDMVEYIYYMSLNYGGMEAFLAGANGEMYLLTGNQPQLDGLKLSADKKKAAYLDTDAETGETVLLQIKLGEEQAETIAANVQSFGYVGNTLLYCFNTAEGVGTLGAEGSEATIPNVSGAQYTEDGVYYVADVDETTGNGELRCWNGKAEEVLATDAFAFQYKGNGKLVYIGNYDILEGLGDLYYYNGKQARSLDTDVTAMFIY